VKKRKSIVGKPSIVKSMIDPAATIVELRFNIHKNCPMTLMLANIIPTDKASGPFNFKRNPVMKII